MKKNTEAQVALKMSLIDRLGENRVITWISENTKNCIYIFFIVLALSFAAYRLLDYWSSKSGYHYILAENKYFELQKRSGEQSGPIADELMAILQSQPDLQAKYDGLLAEFLLVQGDVKKAESLIGRSLKRTADENYPLFTQYAKTTLLIAQGDYNEALTQANQLKKEIVANSEMAGPYLFPLNLIRIGMLQEALGLSDEEMATWREWREYASGKKADKAISAVGFQNVEKVFGVGKIHLGDYIDAREGVLR